MLTTAGLSRSATSANDTRVAAQRGGSRRPRRRVTRWRLRGGRRRRRHGAGHDEPDEERHGGASGTRSRPGTAASWRHYRRAQGRGRVRRPGEAGRESALPHGSASRVGRLISARNAASSSVGTPSVARLVGLAAGVGADDHARRLLADRPGDLAAEPLDGGRGLARGSSTPACRSARRSCPSAGPRRRRATRSSGGTSIRTPAARSRSTSARLRGSSSQLRSDAASTGPISCVSCSCSTGAAAQSASIDPNARASTCAARSPMCRMPRP